MASHIGKVLQRQYALVGAHRGDRQYVYQQNKQAWRRVRRTVDDDLKFARQVDVMLRRMRLNYSPDDEWFNQDEKETD